MTISERRNHFRIDDHIHFDYKVIEDGRMCSDEFLNDELLGQNGPRFLETSHFFHDINIQINTLLETLALKDQALANCFNLLNTELEYLSNQILIDEKNTLKKVNLSLSGIAFTAKKHLPDNTRLKIIIYTKPKMVPILLDAKVIYTQFRGTNAYHTAVEFETLTNEQEQLLSEHILLAQITSRSD